MFSKIFQKSHSSPSNNQERSLSRSPSPTKKIPRKDDRGPEDISPVHSPRENQGRHHQSRSPSKHSGRRHTKSRTIYDSDSHPLNLPPEELKRLSAMAAAEPQAPMDIDSPIPSSPQNTPGSFPSPNGVNGFDQSEPPRPPPHKSPQSPTSSTNAEASKAAGNKFFKAHQYDKAIAEYTRGLKSPCISPMIRTRLMDSSNRRRPPILHV